MSTPTTTYTLQQLCLAVENATRRARAPRSNIPGGAAQASAITPQPLDALAAFLDINSLMPVARVFAIQAIEARLGDRDRRDELKVADGRLRTQRKVLGDADPDVLQCRFDRAASQEAVADGRRAYWEAMDLLFGEVGDGHHASAQTINAYLTLAALDATSARRAQDELAPILSLLQQADH